MGGANTRQSKRDRDYQMCCVERRRCRQDRSESHPFKIGHPVCIGEKESDANYRGGRINIRHDKSNDEPCTRTKRAKCNNRDPRLEAVCPRCVGGCTPNSPSNCGSLRNEDTPKVESPRDRIEPHAVERGANTVECDTAGQGLLIDQRFIKGVWCRSG